jgi:hypothetical protein
MRLCTRQRKRASGRRRRVWIAVEQLLQARWGQIRTDTRQLQQAQTGANPPRVSADPHRHGQGMDGTQAHVLDQDKRSHGLYNRHGAWDHARIVTP